MRIVKFQIGLFVGGMHIYKRLRTPQRCCSSRSPCNLTRLEKRLSKVVIKQYRKYNLNNFSLISYINSKEKKNNLILFSGILFYIPKNEISLFQNLTNTEFNGGKIELYRKK